MRMRMRIYTGEVPGAATTQLEDGETQINPNEKPINCMCVLRKREIGEDSGATR
jgi:hypothetical protein